MALPASAGLLILLPALDGQRLLAMSRAALLAEPERALLLGLELAGWLVALWVFGISTLLLLASSGSSVGRRARQLARRLTPVAARRLVEGAFGIALIAAPSGVAAAATTPPSAPSGRAAATTLAPVPPPIVAPPEQPLPVLDRPAATPRSPAGATASPPAPSRRPPTATPSPKPPTPAPTACEAPQPTAPQAPAPTATHRVVPGDTLWGIARAALPSGASPGQIAEEWQRWYAANLRTIGLDPALLLPGQLLSAPPASPAMP